MFTSVIWKIFQIKFEMVETKTRHLNFQVTHEKSIDYLKGLKYSGGLSVNQYKKIKAVGSSPGFVLWTL